MSLANRFLGHACRTTEDLGDAARQAAKTLASIARAAEAAEEYYKILARDTSKRTHAARGQSVNASGIRIVVPPPSTEDGK